MQTIDLKLLGCREGDLLLDVGCGRGRHSLIAANAGCTTIGIDLSFDDLTAARDQCSEWRDSSAAPFEFMSGDATKLPFQDASVDAIICSEVLEHVPDWRAVVGEFFRVLKPEGVLGVSVPFQWVEQRLWNWDNEYAHEPGGHIRIFSTSDLEAGVERCGFSLFARHKAHGIHSLYWLARCLFRDPEHKNWLVRTLHDWTVKDVLFKPAWTRGIDRVTTPLLGKSVVSYFRRTHG